MKVLLTGGLGFIGSHCVRHWLETTDWDIVVMDGLRYAGDPSRLLRICEGYDLSRVQVLYHDFRAPVHEALKQDIGHIDVIVNAAADSHVDRSISDPVPFVKNNVAIALNALELAREIKPKAFLQMSTDEVYGPAPKGVSHVETDLLAPSNPYAASKAAQEHVAASYWRTFGVPVFITRTMNNFGELQNAEKFVPFVVRRLLADQEIPVHGIQLADGTWESGTRVWLHAANHADAIRFLLERGAPCAYTGQAGGPEVVNVAGELELSNMQIVELAASILEIETHKGKFMDFHSSRPGHDLRYSLDGTKLRRLGWEQPRDFHASFRETILAIKEEVQSVK